MTRPTIRCALAALLGMGLCLPIPFGVPIAGAASMRQSAPPGVKAARPTVSGRLVARATTKAPTAPVVCNDRELAPTRMLNRGLVVCTEEGKLVLLQMSASTGIYNRDWQRLVYARLRLGDEINAWGALGTDGFLLNPTVAVQDLSQSGPRLQTVTGRLVAKPNAAPAGPVLCGNRDRSPDAETLMNRGLVVCTPEGKMVLLQLSSSTRLYTQDGSTVGVPDLTRGDHLTGHGTLQSGGFLLDPTVTVVDHDLRRKGANSQDFIAKGGSILTLYVLQSDPGPVEGIVHAAPGEPPHITLCGGHRGAWSDLREGLTIDVSGSLFNTRTMSYVDTNIVAVVSCR